MTWRVRYNKKLIHYHIESNRSLCNRIVDGKSSPTNPNGLYDKCRSCMRIFCTYDDIANYIPTMETPGGYS